MAVAIAVTVDVAVDATVDVDVDVVVCRVSCVVCRVSCVVCRVSCIVCRVRCIVCHVSNFVWCMSLNLCNFNVVPFLPPPPPYNVLFFLKNGVCGPLYFFRTVAKSGVECCCLHSAGVDLFWGTPLEILICPTGEWHTGVAAWTVCKLAQEAEKPCGRYRNIFRSTEVPPGLFSKNEAPV